MSRIQYLPRPIIIHFVQLVGRNRNLSIPECTDADSQKSVAESQESDHRADSLFLTKGEKVEDDEEEDEGQEVGHKNFNFDNDRLEKEREMEKRGRKEEVNVEHQKHQQDKSEELQNREKEEEDNDEGRGQGSARKPSGGIYIATSFTQAKIPGQERLKSSTVVLNDLIGNKIENREGDGVSIKKEILKVENSSITNTEAENEFDFFSDDVLFLDSNKKANTNTNTNTNANANAIEKDMKNLENEFNDLFDNTDFKEIVDNEKEIGRASCRERV